MREPVDDNGETITFSHGFWNVWAGELVKFSVVPTLHRAKCKATDPGKSWGYWKRNIEEEEEDVEVGEIVELGFL